LNPSTFDDEDFAPSQVSSSQAHFTVSYPDDPSGPEDGVNDDPDDSYLNDNLGPPSPPAVCDDSLHNIINLNSDNDLNYLNLARNGVFKSPGAVLSDGHKGSCGITHSSSTKSLSSILCDKQFVSLAQDARWEPGEMIGEIHRLHQQLNALEGTIVDQAIQLDSVNTHCMLAHQEVSDLQGQLANKGKQKAWGSTKIMS
jgi:hypothetical protein